MTRKRQNSNIISNSRSINATLVSELTPTCKYSNIRSFDFSKNSLVQNKLGTDGTQRLGPIHGLF